MNRVFVDADVILDLFVLREPFHLDSLRLFSQLKRTRTPAFTSPVVAANVHYILSRIRNPRYALEKLKRLRKLMSIAPVTEEIMDAAINSPHKDFEDSIQFQCAVTNKMSVIVTRNVRDFPRGTLRIAEPVEYLSSKRT
jgi:predicted nucleic acid-binding protein